MRPRAVSHLPPRTVSTFNHMPPPARMQSNLNAFRIDPSARLLCTIRKFSRLLLTDLLDMEVLVDLIARIRVLLLRLGDVD